MLFMSSGRSSMEHSTLSLSMDSISIPRRRAKGALYISTASSTRPFMSSDILARISSLSMLHPTGEADITESQDVHTSRNIIAPV